jgi:hypothetical protein
MRLFVGPLPEVASQEDVRDFIETALRPRGPFAFFKKTVGRVSCAMMEVAGRDGRGPIYFAIVHVHPASFADKVIVNLNGATIRGRTVTVRKFTERNPANERRREVASEHPWNRRNRDRRGHAVRRTNASNRQVVFAPVKGFAREYKD